MRARLGRCRDGGWTSWAVHAASPEPDSPARAHGTNPTWARPCEDDPDPVTSITLMPESASSVPVGVRIGGSSRSQPLCSTTSLTVRTSLRTTFTMMRAGSATTSRWSGPAEPTSSPQPQPGTPSRRAALAALAGARVRLLAAVLGRLGRVRDLRRSLLRHPLVLERLVLLLVRDRRPAVVSRLLRVRDTHREGRRLDAELQTGASPVARRRRVGTGACGPDARRSWSPTWCRRGASARVSG